MQLVFEQTRNRFGALTTFAERDLPKAAGLRWDKGESRWFAPKVTAAVALRAHADEATAALLDAAIVQADADEAAADALTAKAIEASRATDAAI